MVTSAFRGALNDGDAARCRLIWAEVFPNMPQPSTHDEATVMMHQARTAAKSVRLEKRLYSHAWLIERAHRSQLPDELRPRPIHPIIVPAVGVSVNSHSTRADRREEAKFIEKAMADAAADAMLSGVTDPVKVSRIMWQARETALRRL